MAVTYVIKKGDSFMKSSYDSDNGMWSPHMQRAKVWKTRKGVQAFYDRYISIWRLTGREPVIVEVR